MTVEAWKSFFDVAAVVLLFLTFAAGAGILVSGNIINGRQAKQLQQFESDLTKAKTDLAKQQTRAAEAETETAKLKILVAGREITPEQSLQISSSLKRFSGEQVFIASYIGDAEAARLGLQIKSALKKAGIKAEDRMGSTFAIPNDAGSVAFGIGISTSPAKLAFGEALAKALHDEAGLDTKTHVAPMIGGWPETGIMVAVKPIPAIK